MSSARSTQWRSEGGPSPFATASTGRPTSSSASRSSTSSVSSRRDTLVQLLLVPGTISSRQGQAFLAGRGASDRKSSANQFMNIREYFCLKSLKGGGRLVSNTADSEALTKLSAVFHLSLLCLPRCGLHSQADASGWQRRPPASRSPQLGSPVERQHFFPRGSRPSPRTASRWLRKITCPSLNQSLWLEGCLHAQAPGVEEIPTLEPGIRDSLTQPHEPEVQEELFPKGKLGAGIRKGREAGRQEQQKIGSVRLLPHFRPHQ